MKTSRYGLLTLLGLMILNRDIELSLRKVWLDNLFGNGQLYGI
jgi:hypothetical protein